MKRNRSFLTLFGIVAVIALALIAADHIEAPGVSGGTSDITDYYAFQGEDNSNLVFVANVQGLLSPSATAGASFDENVMIEFNIDNDGDLVEDLVIQAIPRDGTMYFFGPVAPTATGLSSVVEESAMSGEVEITAYGSAAAVVGSSADGMMFFAGPRDDPFFMDFTRYTEIIAGTETQFSDPGTDTFAGTNVMSVVVEVPKSMLGAGVGANGTLHTWVESKRKQ